MHRLLVLLILPFISRWITASERRILAKGVPLNEQSLADAHTIGVQHPKQVRLLKVREVPLPAGPLIKLATYLSGSPGDRTAGLTARYGIFIHEAYWGDRRLIAHELAHTAQYERLGGIRPFLRRYLTECLIHGYAGAPLEHEAIAAAAEIG